MINRARLITLFCIVTAPAMAQTTGGGQIVDTEFQELRLQVAEMEARMMASETVAASVEALSMEVESIRALVEALDTTGSVDLAPVLARLDAAETKLVGLEPPCEKCNDTSITNIAKTTALHYFRLAFVEYDIDPFGNVTSCWDSGGRPDEETLECICPAGSTWTPDSNPQDLINDASCKWDNPGTAVGDKQPTAPDPEQPTNPEQPAEPDPGGTTSGGIPPQ